MPNLRPSVPLLFAVLLTSASASAGQDLYISGPLDAGSVELQLNAGDPGLDESAGLDFVFRYGVIEKLEVASQLNLGYLFPGSGAAAVGFSVGAKYAILDILDIDLDVPLVSLVTGTGADALAVGVAVDFEYHQQFTDLVSMNARFDFGDFVNDWTVNSMGLLLEPTFSLTDMFVLYIDVTLYNFKENFDMDVVPNLDIVLTDKFGLNVGAGAGGLLSDAAATFYISGWLGL